jgi:hypothetical protein
VEKGLGGGISEKNILLHSKSTRLGTHLFCPCNIWLSTVRVILGLLQVRNFHASAYFLGKESGWSVRKNSLEMVRSLGNGGGCEYKNRRAFKHNLKKKIYSLIELMPRTD